MAIRAHKVNIPSRNRIHRWSDRKWGESLQIRLSTKGFHLQTRSPTRDELKRIWVDYRERTELPEEHRKRTKSEEVHDKAVVILAETKERGVIFNWKSTKKQMGLIQMIYENIENDHIRSFALGPCFWIFFPVIADYALAIISLGSFIVILSIVLADSG